MSVNHMLKGLFATLTSFVLAVGFVPATFAQTNGTSYINSGDNGQISSVANSTNATDVTNRNTANVNQQVTSDTNTGYNSANRNIGGGVVATGNAVTQTGMAADVNRNYTAVSGGAGSYPVANLSDLINTGDGTNAQSTTNTNNSVRVNNDNTTNLNQTLNAKSNTGYNSADRNIGGGGVYTGSAGTGAVMSAYGNNNLTSVDNGMGMTGGYYMPSNATSLTNTGDNANVFSSYNSNSETSVNNNNNAAINQTLNSKANTGYNSAGRNIGGGYVATGDAITTGRFYANPNTNMTFVTSPTLSGYGSNLQDIVNTGNNLGFNAATNLNNRNAVSNANNANTNQTTSALSNTGYNAGNSNVGGGLFGGYNGLSGVSTGNAGTGGGFYSGGNANATSVGTSFGANAMNTLLSLLSY